MSALATANGEDFSRVWSRVVTSLPDWMAGLERELRDVHLAREGLPTKRASLSENALAALTALYREYGGATLRVDRKRSALA